MTFNGSNIITSLQVVRAFWEEAEAFKEELWDSLKNPSFPNPSVKFIEEIEGEDSSSYHGGSPWVYDGWHWSFRAVDNRSGPGKKKTAGQLSVLMDIGGENRPARHLKFPCIVIAWAHGSGSDWASEFQEFWPTEAAAAKVSSERLFVTKDSDANGSMRTAHWFYILPLTSVSDPAAMIRLIVKPVLTLVGGKTVETTFDEAPEVLRFNNKSGVVNAVP